MVEINSVLCAVYAAVRELNRMVADEDRLDESPQTRLFGRAGELDSLGLINMIVLTENAIEDEFGVELSLVPDGAGIGDENPFETIDTLARFIHGQINDPDKQ